jgi:hypothetical protein
MDMLVRMRDEVPEPSPDRLHHARARLDEALRARRGRALPWVAWGLHGWTLPRWAWRGVIAACLAAAVAVTGAVLALPSRPGSTGNAAVHPETKLRLVAAATKRAGSFRFSATQTWGDGSYGSERGLWDPVGPKSIISAYENGRLIEEIRIKGREFWNRHPGTTWRVYSAWRSPEELYATLVQPLFLNSGSSQPGASAIPVRAQPTPQPGDLLEQLVDGGAQIKDLGVSGHGAAAVHTFSFRVVLPPLPLRGAERVETGTIAVSVATGLISKIAWSQPAITGWPNHIVTVASTLEYSDYGLPVDVPAP